MKKQEKKGPTGEMFDEKPPVIQSGHMENRIIREENSQNMVDKWGETGL